MCTCTSQFDGMWDFPCPQAVFCGGGKTAWYNLFAHPQESGDALRYYLTLTLLLRFCGKFYTCTNTLY